MGRGRGADVKLMRPKRSRPNSGGELIFDCPFCGKHWKLWVNVRKGRFHCFYCEAGGSNHYLLRATPDCEWPEEVIESAQTASLPLGSSSQREPDYALKRHFVCPWYLSPSALKEAGVQIALPIERVAEEGFYDVLDFIHQRGVDVEILRCWRVHYAIIKDLEYLLFPCYDTEGTFLWFTARRLGWRGPKYLTPLCGGDKFPLLSPRFLRSRKDFCVIVEGAFDAVAVDLAGFPTVAALGKNINEGLAALLREIGVEKAIIFADSDVPLSKVITNVGRLDDAGIDTHFVFAPKGKDPGDLSVSEIQAILREPKRANFSSYIQQLLTNTRCLSVF